MKCVHFLRGPVSAVGLPNLSQGGLLPWIQAAIFPFILQASVPAQVPVNEQTAIPAYAPAPAQTPLGGHAQTQGIEGTVFLISGNQMPSPDRKPTVPKPTQAIVCVYELTNNRQVTRQNHSSGYSSIATRKIVEEKTDTAGHFRIFLSPGRYSVFVKAGTRYYANGSDAENNLAPVVVSPGKMTEVTGRVEGDRPAAY